MKYLTILISVLFLVSCEKSGEKTFENIEPNKDYEVKHILLDDLKAVDEEYDRIYALDTSDDKIEYEAGERYGFTYFMGDTCYIVMGTPDNYSLKEFERTLGHEHTHCIYGSWHR